MLDRPATATADGVDQVAAVRGPRRCADRVARLDDGGPAAAAERGDEQLVLTAAARRVGDSPAVGRPGGAGDPTVHVCDGLVLVRGERVDDEIDARCCRWR